MGFTGADGSYKIQVRLGKYKVLVSEPSDPL